MLSAGTLLGPYEVLSPLGAGGMGEVYRARDPRLGREVAIKVLPEAVATDPDRLRAAQAQPRGLHGDVALLDQPARSPTRNPHRLEARAGPLPRVAKGAEVVSEPSSTLLA